MAEENTKKTRKNEKNERYDESSVWEWIIAAAGLILVSGAVGFMIYEAAIQEDQPPKFSFRIESITPGESDFLVRFELENTGDETASAVAVEGELKRGGESVEKNSSTLDYAPSHSTRQGGIFFTKNPSEFELKLRVAGYEKP